MELRDMRIQTHQEILEQARKTKNTLRNISHILHGTFWGIITFFIIGIILSLLQYTVVTVISFGLAFLCMLLTMIIGIWHGHVEEEMAPYDMVDKKDVLEIMDAVQSLRVPYASTQFGCPMSSTAYSEIHGKLCELLEVRNYMLCFEYDAFIEAIREAQSAAQDAELDQKLEQRRTVLCHSESVAE